MKIAPLYLEVKLQSMLGPSSGFVTIRRVRNRNIDKSKGNESYAGFRVQELSLVFEGELNLDIPVFPRMQFTPPFGLLDVQVHNIHK